MYARIENDAVVEYPIPSITLLFPNTSFPVNPTDADLPDGYVRVYTGPQPQPGPGGKLVSLGPVFDGERWVEEYEVVALSIEEAEAAATQLAQQAYEARRAAYQQESDPIFFQWQRGEATQQDWLDKIAEIKARYPDGLVSQ